MDLMGTLIVVGLVFFHNAQIFGSLAHYVTNTQHGTAAETVANSVFALARRTRVGGSFSLKALMTRTRS